MQNVTTPNGKKISVRQYLSMQQRALHSTKGGHDCEHGHFECAAWSGGPCAAELAAALDGDGVQS